MITVVSLSVRRTDYGRDPSCYPNAGFQLDCNRAATICSAVDKLHDVILTYISGFFGTIAFLAITMGYLVWRTTVVEWIVAAIGPFLCFFPNLPTDRVGIALSGAVWFWQRYDVKRSVLQMAKA
jgi:TRAP-type uncharacterized transport system fused permease subunit